MQQPIKKRTFEEELFEKSSHGLELESEESSSRKKPERVILIMTYSTGEERKEALFGADVPDREDWEDMADKRWLKDEQSPSGPPVLIRMIDDAGRIYLRDLRY